ncbi:transcriptional regulator GutM [Psychromonas sp.]|uniref:transcriptional regulator GutM n=1 Tax=Psychromonas sp. TaxID=1884585 RepID=UPI003A985ED8
MDSTSLLIIVAIVAWTAQIGMSFFQVRAFNRMIQSMAKKGNVKIGRTKSRWKARTIVVLVEGNDGAIIDARVLHGITVFARPKALPELIGYAFPLDKKRLHGLSQGTLEAIDVAFQNE